MASNIISNTIDTEYPIAGQDNDSQGFRDNFSIIKTGLTTAASEITTLQTTTAKLNEDNDFNGNNIQEANFIATTEEVRINGPIIASQNISFRVGHYQTLQVGNDITLTLSDWPASGVMGRVRLVINADSSNRTITWNVGGGGTFRANQDWPDTFTIQANDYVVVDLWTSDGGLTVYGLYHGVFD